MVLLAGVAEAVVTPPVGVEMIEPRGIATTGVHDDLFVRVLGLAGGETRLAIVTMDLLGLDLELLAATRAAVERAAGLPPERVMLTASHTHSAPSTIGWGRGVQARRDRAWDRRVVDALAGCVARALDALVPVTLAVGRQPVQIGANRRLSDVNGTRMVPNPRGPVAPWVDVLRLDRAEGAGAPLAVLFSHACHPVTVHSAGREFSADFPGVACATVRRRLGEGVMAMFAQACGGDINVQPLMGGYAAAERVGTVLGDAAVAAAQTAQQRPVDRLRTAMQEISLPFELLTAEQVEALLARAREGEAALDALGADWLTRYNQRELLLWAERMREFATTQGPRGLPLWVQGFALGDDVAVLGLSHEVFVAYQLFFQERSPFPHTLVLGYTNGCAHYVPTAEEFVLGGYEVIGAPKLYGWPSLRPDCERLVKDSGLAVLSALRPG
jgi:hypothetical protein